MSRAGHVHSFDFLSIQPWRQPPATPINTSAITAFIQLHSAQYSAQSAGSAQSSAGSAGSAPETLLLVFSMQWLTT
jgi:hypothetical protein